MLRNIGKFLLGGIGIVALGVGIIFAIDYVRYQRSPEYRAMQEIENTKREYAEDPYGGETPEETLRLFIEALKKGDTELAAKYFVLEKQEEWREDLARLEDKALLDETIDDLEKVKLTKKTDKTAFFTLVGENNVAISELIIDINPLSNKWKISEF